MIKINLLPEELQRSARTPPKFFIAIVAGVVLVAVLNCAYGSIYLNTVVLEERVSRKRSEVEHFQNNAKEVDALLEDIADYKEREKAIIAIKTNRILWSKKLAMLCNITPTYIWIVRLEMRELESSEYTWKPGELQTGGYLLLHCYSSGDEVERMTNYRQRLKSVEEFYLHFAQEDIKPDNFYSDFINITPPEWKFVQLPGFLEPNNIRFAVRLDLRPLVAKT